MSKAYVVFPRIVYRVLARLQGNLCAGCGQPVSRSCWTVDHVIPRSRGGFLGFGNIVMMDGGCNTRKSNRMPNGCELIWLMAVNARLGVGPQRMFA